MNQIFPDYWMSLPVGTRERLHVLFALNKSVGAEVVDGVVVCDGHTAGDLSAITLEHLQSVLNSVEQDFWKLWKQVIGEEAPVKAEEKVEKAVKRAGRPRKGTLGVVKAKKK